MSAVAEVDVDVRSLAQAFVSRSNGISPTVLRLGGGNAQSLSVDELEAIIIVDPEFSLRAMALANSAFYSQQYEISSLRAALVVLGSEAVQNLASNLLARSLHKSPTAIDDSLWQHCLAVAIAAQMLCEKHRKVDSRSAFAAGLLHDIGLLAMPQPNPNGTASTVSHEILGAEIAELLGLSSSLVDAIRFHESGIIEEQSMISLNSTICAANEIALHCGFAHDHEISENDDLLERIGGGFEMTSSDIDALVAELPGRVELQESFSS